MHSAQLQPGLYDLPYGWQSWRAGLGRIKQNGVHRERELAVLGMAHELGWETTDLAELLPERWREILSVTCPRSLMRYLPDLAAIPRPDAPTKPALRLIEVKGGKGNGVRGYHLNDRPLAGYLRWAELFDIWLVLPDDLCAPVQAIAAMRCERMPDTEAQPYCKYWDDPDAPVLLPFMEAFKL